PGLPAPPTPPPSPVPALSAPSQRWPRLERRYAMLAEVDRQQKDAEETSSSVKARDSFYEKAHGLITSPRAKKAFDLTLESPRTRERYGRTAFRQSCLLARRLVEAGGHLV